MTIDDEGGVITLKFDNTYSAGAVRSETHVELSVPSPHFTTEKRSLVASLIQQAQGMEKVVSAGVWNE